MAVTPSTILATRLQQAALRARNVRKEASRKASLQTGTEPEARQLTGDLIGRTPLNGQPPQR